MRKTVEVEPILDYFKKNMELHRDLFYDKQNSQMLGMYKAYRDAYEFVKKTASE